jgi:uncharacterized protein (DUF885 family)
VNWEGKREKGSMSTDRLSNNRSFRNFIQLFLVFNQEHMKKAFFLIACIIVIASCKLSNSNQQKEDNKELAALLERYYDKRMELFPLEATVNGDNRFNHLLPADFTDSYRARIKELFGVHLTYLKSFERETLNDNDKASYDLFKYEMEMGLDGLALNYMGSSALGDNSLMPFDQFNGVPLTLGQMGGGTGNQPFKTVQDYDNWLQRATAFGAWADSAIVYFRKGIAANYVLPGTIVVKMIPQLEAMIVEDPKKSLFYEPINLLHKAQGGNDKDAMGLKYERLISGTLVPAYKKLRNFLRDEYLPKARTTTGVNALPDGDKYYKYTVKYWTTTNKSPEEIYNTGLAEVKRIRDEMEKVKSSVNFKGDLKAFFEFMKTDKQFMPYKTAEEVIAAFRNIQKRIDPNLKKMYSQVPKTKFEIRQTEAFRAASASAEYYPGLEGERAGIFYVPIVDATKFNTTSGMESLFLHEAIPGHYYQMSLQSENKKLPKFRKFIWYGAYGEGYALYCESLGKELGLYTDPYQYMGALGDEIHRAIRLVVDVAMHIGKMTREEAIKYMMDNEAISEEGATAEIERYMVYPGQALSYKTGALKIKELREKYLKQLGSKFKLDKFHDKLLDYGCMPLDVLEQQMDDWAKGQ